MQSAQVSGFDNWCSRLLGIANSCQAIGMNGTAIEQIEAMVLARLGGEFPGLKSARGFDQQGRQSIRVTEFSLR